MAKYNIREMVLDDVETISDIEIECFPSPWSSDSFVNELTTNKLARYYVIEVSKVIAGYIGVWHIVDEGHITNVAIRPAFRGEGYGKALVEYLKTTAIEGGIRWLTLEVRVGNAPAISLYEQMGFETKGIRKKYYQDNGEDALIMWCALIEGVEREQVK